jgi:nicotinamide phosphoribosyltransferase
VARRLDAAFGSTVNRKGYKVLNRVRVIYGDGINLTSIRGILLGLKLAGYSADNIAFGMGGVLLQRVGRDDLSFAQKMSAIEVNGEWRDVFKSPATDPNKRSLAGRVTTVTREDGQYAVSPLTAAEDADALRVVFENGELLVAEPFSVLRSRG